MKYASKKGASMNTLTQAIESLQNHYSQKNEIIFENTLKEATLLIAKSPESSLSYEDELILNFDLDQQKYIAVFTEDESIKNFSDDPLETIPVTLKDLYRLVQEENLFCVINPGQHDLILDEYMMMQILEEQEDTTVQLATVGTQALSLQFKLKTLFESNKEIQEAYLVEVIVNNAPHYGIVVKGLDDKEETLQNTAEAIQDALDSSTHFELYSAHDAFGKDIMKFTKPFYQK